MSGLHSLRKSAGFEAGRALHEAQRQLPFCRYPGEPGTVPCRIGPPVNIRFGLSGSFFFLFLMVIVTMGLCTLGVLFLIMRTDALAQTPHPVTRPGEFQPENGEAKRNYNNGGTRRNQHNETQQQDGTADQRYGYALGNLVGIFQGIHCSPSTM